MVKSSLGALLVVVTLCYAAYGNESTIKPANIDWQLWQNLPVQSGGREKPLDTFAAETLYATSCQTTVFDTQANKALSPTVLYLTLLFEWSGWDHQRKEDLLNVSDVASEYAFYHQADRWDKTQLLTIEHAGLKKMLGLPERVTFVSPAILAATSIIDPRTQTSIPFAAWGEKVQELKDTGQALTQAEAKGLELAQRLDAFRAERMGLNAGVVPDLRSNDGTWLSLAALLLTKFDDANDTQGHYRQAQRLLWQARSDFRKGDVEAFNRSSATFRDAVGAVFAAAASSPNQFLISSEVVYNRWQPFRIAWLCLVLAFVGMLLASRIGRPSLYWSAIASFLLGSLALLVGITMRVILSGRPPVTNMYETVVFVAAGVAALGLIFAVRYGQQHALTATAAVSALLLFAANRYTTVLGSSIQPLEPLLSSRTWLVAHVMTVTLSYAAFAFAWGTANTTLAYGTLRIRRPDRNQVLSGLTVRSLQLGVVLLAFGMVFGCMWADSTWGRFWAWDPKEAWALITLLGYVGILRFWERGSLADRGLAVASVLCFFLVVMTWYGINVVLRTGLHNFGVGDGGRAFVGSAAAIQVLYVAFALHRSKSDHVQADIAAAKIGERSPRTDAACLHGA